MKLSREALGPLVAAVRYLNVDDLGEVHLNLDLIPRSEVRAALDLATLFVEKLQQQCLAPSARAELAGQR